MTPRPAPPGSAASPARCWRIGTRISFASTAAIIGDRLIGDADGGYLYGGKGSDVLEDGGHDAIGTRLYGGEGNDKFYMFSATGSKSDGGEGNDTFTILDDTVKQNITGGNGSDTLIYRDLDDTTSESVVVNVATGIVTAGGVTVASAKGIENAFTESGKDTFYGDAQIQCLQGRRRSRSPAWQERRRLPPWWERQRLPQWRLRQRLDERRRRQ